MPGLKVSYKDFPGGPVVKNPPSNAGGQGVGSLVRGIKVPRGEQYAPPPKKVIYNIVLLK